MLEFENEAGLGGDLHHRFRCESARPLDQPQLLLQSDVDVAINAELDLVVASDGGVAKGLFDVHIIFKSNGWTIHIT